MIDADDLEEIRTGLSMPQKQISSKFFYDHRGSALFEEITELPDYYPSRTERALLEALIPAWVKLVKPCTLVELGAGSAAKTRIILDAMRDADRAARFVPIDVSAEFLQATAEAVQEDYPGLETTPIVADLTEAMELPHDLPVPVLYAFLGSTIGNFTTDGAVALLKRVQSEMTDRDTFLMGVDLRKDPARLEAAYNDSRGVTAEFNLNLLNVLNREAGANFDSRAFLHRAIYNTEAHRIEMHLVSTSEQTVTIPGIGEISFDEGESIRTEISCKYDRPSVEALFSRAGLRMMEWEIDPEGLYALVLAGV